MSDEIIKLSEKIKWKPILSENRYQVKTVIKWWVKNFI